MSARSSASLALSILIRNSHYLSVCDSASLFLPHTCRKTTSLPSFPSKTELIFEMKLTTTTFTATLALFASAANSANVKSTSFRLALVSADQTYNGLALTSCHLSSGYEVLCPGAAASSNPPYSSYNLNGTTSNPNVGTLTWELPGNGGPDSTQCTLPSPSQLLTLHSLGDNASRRRRDCKSRIGFLWRRVSSGDHRGFRQ